MSTRQALVVHTRMPAFDRDSGSQDIDNTIGFLLRAGWQVTFLAREDQGLTEQRHADRLRRMGVATHSGFDATERILRSAEFDLAVIAYWELAAALIPKIRAASPDTRIVINSMDIHFLRNARRALGQHDQLDSGFGSETTDELNTYHAADAVITVSDKERDLLGDFLGRQHVFTVPLAEDIARSAVPLDERRGMYFVGNFRHVPNREAVEYICSHVLPLLDPDLLARHPLTILGNWLDRVTLDVDPTAPGVRMVGWVPSIQPYVEHSRLTVVPLRHGAGVKRKVMQAMMAGTPVVTTPVGAEGLDLTQGHHALIAADAADFAAGIARLLTDDDLWHRLVDAGADHVNARHGVALVEQRFTDVIDQVMATRNPADSVGSGTGGRRSEGGDRDTATVLRTRMRTIARPGDVVLVASGGDEDLIDLGSQPCWPFPESRDGGWAGFEPVDSAAAINHLEAQRTRGARYFVLPRPKFAWRHRYPELFQHLGCASLRVHQDEHLIVYDLADRTNDAVQLDPTPTLQVQVLGTYASERTGPHPDTLTELDTSEYLTVDQSWRPDTDPHEASRVGDADYDYVVTIGDDAILPGRFLDSLIATQVTLGADRIQPTHTGGPAGGAPVTERHFGTVAREVDAPTALPVLSRRTDAAPDGPVTLADNVTVGLRNPGIPASTMMGATGDVRRTWIIGDDRRPIAHARVEPEITPRISVLIATYERPELLRSCLATFADQTLDRDEFEVVIVDDGSQRDDLTAVVEEFHDRLQLVGLRIAHAGRSAAKNHAVFLARAPIVLFFDDDDRAAPDYLERHLDGHAAKPNPGVAILGHTDWAPELELTPLMHYITDVDRLMFAYERLGDGQQLDWRGFWEGRISVKRSLLLTHGLHDQRLNYSIDVEMGWRLAPAGLRVIYNASARSFMARPIDFPAFCDRTEAKGRAHSVVAALHPGTEIASRLQVTNAAEIWADQRLAEAGLRRRVADLEARVSADPSVLSELQTAYRETFRLLHAKGAAGATEGSPAMSGSPVTVPPFPNTDPPLVFDGTPAEWSAVEPLISVTIPVWSRTPELAAMVQRTIERIWSVAQVPTEIVVVDNGSPHEVPLAAKVYRYHENRGVSVGWNTGIRLSNAAVVVVFNSDCHVEPGWDLALYEAALDDRRVAFPYTDHCDGAGYTQPDQGGTAGWCFMISKALYDEIGVFDEWFSPAYCEDTDYWHRAWQMGVELSPVPAARVVHARRTSGDSRSDMLLQAHRYKYGWKHNVDPDRAPPYYNREITEYVGSFRVPSPATDRDPGRPRVFGIGLNKTGTTSLHKALEILGYTSLHWGGPALRHLVEASVDSDEPLLSRLDPRFDAFSDILALSTNFDRLDKEYPDSRFILTVRPVEEWIASRRRHVESNLARRQTGDYDGKFLTVDEAAWREEWETHLDRVRTHFAGRDNFLELDLTASADWGPVCKLLDVDEPVERFPHANARASSGDRRDVE